MTEPVSDIDQLLRTMEPKLNDGVYVYSSLPKDANIASIETLAMFHESEGITIIATEEAARKANLTVLFRAAWITLTVHSDLEAVGLTAAFARALGDAGISCNVVAAAYHDHIFVPVERAQDALHALRSVQQSAEISPR